MPSYSFSPDGVETWSDRFLAVLANLNQAISDSGALLEGNLFYFHLFTEYLGTPPDRLRGHKRRNFCRALRGKNSLLEIGFNAGHSALLALSAHPGLQYTGIDICQNPYTPRCGEIMKAAFGERFNLIIADSREILPYMAAYEPRRTFDLFHVDGGHEDGNCRADISNCLRLAPWSGGRLVLDDTARQSIRGIFNEFESLGQIRSDSLDGTWEKDENLCAEMLPLR